MYGNIPDNTSVVNVNFLNNNIYSGTGTSSTNSLLNTSDFTKNRASIQPQNLTNINSTSSNSGFNNYLPNSTVVVQNARISSYPNEISVGAALMRAPASSSKFTTNLPITALNNANISASSHNACSSYSVVLPTNVRTDSVILQNMVRESPSVTPNQGSTTPTNSQLHTSNSHSSPRPSILRKLYLKYTWTIPLYFLRQYAIIYLYKIKIF